MIFPRDTLIISIGNCLTSIFAGFAIFSGIGFIAKQLGKNVEDVVAGGILFIPFFYIFFLYATFPEAKKNGQITRLNSFKMCY